MMSRQTPVPGIWKYIKKKGMVYPDNGFKRVVGDAEDLKSTHVFKVLDKCLSAIPPRPTAHKTDVSQPLNWSVWLYILLQACST